MFSSDLAVVIGLLATGLWVRARSRQTRTWPQGVGRITELRVVREPTMDHVPLFFPHVRYAYRVAETAYLGTRLRVGDHATSSESHARARLEPFQIGAPVPVFHDPRDPEQSVLEHGSSGLAAVLVVSGGALLLLGVLAGGILLTFR